MVGRFEPSGNQKLSLRTVLLTSLLRNSMHNVSTRSFSSSLRVSPTRPPSNALKEGTARELRETLPGRFKIQHPRLFRRYCSYLKLWIFPICRICHATQSEAPSQRMLKPCRCSGTQVFVHLSCLNEWRSMRASAFYECPVCKFK